MCLAEQGLQEEKLVAVAERKVVVLPGLLMSRRNCMEAVGRVYFFWAD